jgi:hypothetical protein
MMRLYAKTDLNWPFGGANPTPVQLQALTAQMPPVPPGPPPAIQPVNLLNAEATIYSGSGVCQGRGKVLYKLTKNAAKGLASLFINTGAGPAENEATTLRMQFHLSLLAADPPNKETLIKSPIGGSTAWGVIKKNSLNGAIKAAWNEFPDEVKIGVALGDPWFGLIHLLSGHASTINSYLASAAGSQAVFQTGVQADRMALNTSGLQALISESFGENGLNSIEHAGGSRFVLRARDNRKLVIDKQGGAAHHTATTMYGADQNYSGQANLVWSRN